MKNILVFVLLFSVGVCVQAQTPVNNNLKENESFSATIPIRFSGWVGTSPTDPQNPKYSTGLNVGINLGVRHFKKSPVPFLPIKNLFITPHGGCVVRGDNKGRDYNNLEACYGGVRLVGTFRSGAVTVDFRRVEEHRRISKQTKGGFTVGVDAYSIWGIQPSDDKRDKKFLSGTFGSASGYFGHLSVLEDDFYYGAGVRQAVTLAKLGPAYLSSFVEAGFDKGAQGNYWSNTTNAGIGLQVDIPKAGFAPRLSCQYGVERYLTENLPRGIRRSSGAFACSISTTLRFYPRKTF